MATVHAKEEKLTFSCRLCDRKFAQQFRLIEHEKSHLAYEQREFVCNKCPEKRFSTINRWGKKSFFPFSANYRSPNI